MKIEFWVVEVMNLVEEDLFFFSERRLVKICVGGVLVMWVVL